MNRSRNTRLPQIQELTKKQEEALSLPRDGQHLVIGGPGTGKSVVALHRALMCARKNIEHVFLVFNRLLARYCDLLVRERSLKPKTYEHWIRAEFHKCFREACPTLEKMPNSNYAAIDWQKMLATILKRSEACGGPRPHVIIDEGQDMPQEFYRALMGMGFRNFFVVADQNQQIEPERHSSRRQIEDVLAINPEDVKELDENWRNSFFVARLAREFYTDPASPLPELPPEPAPEDLPANPAILFTFRENQFGSVIGKILKMADRNPQRLLGIICHNNNTRDKYVTELCRADVNLDNPRPNIQTYQSGGYSNQRFDQGGIMVINMKSCKGLEFDTVFIADINDYFSASSDPDLLRKQFYVMVARARERVIMLRRAGGACPADRILRDIPTSILKTWPVRNEK